MKTALLIFLALLTVPAVPQIRVSGVIIYNFVLR